MDGWHTAVAAARLKQKPLYFVNHIGGGTVDCTTSLESAREYISAAHRPHLYRILKQVNGNLYPVR